jgi:hypothetical protein
LNCSWIEQAEEDGHYDLAVDWANIMDDLRCVGVQNPSLSSPLSSKETSTDLLIGDSMTAALIFYGRALRMMCKSQLKICSR